MCFISGGLPAVVYDGSRRAEQASGLFERLEGVSWGHQRRPRAQPPRNAALESIDFQIRCSVSNDLERALCQLSGLIVLGRARTAKSFRELLQALGGDLNLMKCYMPKKLENVPKTKCPAPRVQNQKAGYLFSLFRFPYASRHLELPRCSGEVRGVRSSRPGVASGDCV